MDLSPAAKKAEFSSEKKINDLSDGDLSEVFKRLPPYDRLIASEVCRRWHGLSRKEWLDITQLDLSPIPGNYVDAVVRQCPNLRSVFAHKKCFDPNERHCIARANQLSNVKFYDCCFPFKTDANFLDDGFAQIFSENIQHTSWDELVLHEVHLLCDKPACFFSPGLRCFSAACFPASLTRLQISGLHFECHPDFFLDALDGLQNLECFILHSTPDSIEHRDLFQIFYSYIFEKMCALKNLKELCIGPAIGPYLVRRLVSNVPKLEVLFLNDVCCGSIEIDLQDLIMGNSVLRILVLSGEFHRYDFESQQIELPARKRFPNGFGSDPLPLLHIFVGKETSERIRFAKSSADAAVVHPINEPMPQFLARADIAPIFEGVWVAEKIVEAARHGGKLWNYELHDAATSVQNI